MITYESHVKPSGKKFKKIDIDKATVKKVSEFVNEMVKTKKRESHHQIDGRSHFKRFYTGTLGEVALEKYLGVSGIVDWTIGNSVKYHNPDLSNLNIKAGIKTVEYGLFPIIFKKSYSHEIINIRYQENIIYICGIASPETLNNFQSLDLIKDENLRNRGTKTGFYGFENLEQFSDIANLKNIINNRK